MSTPISLITFAELCEMESLESEAIIAMVEHGIIKPLKGELKSDWEFEVTAIHWIEKSIRLATDFEIDWIAVALIIDLMQQKEILERENQCYRLQLERFIKP